MRKLLVGTIGLAAIGLGAVASLPAQAQPYFPGPVTVEFRDGRHHRPVFAPIPERHRSQKHWRRHGHHRGASFHGRRCFVRMEQAWNGWRWIERPVRICR